jgi:hypothetical protein
MATVYVQQTQGGCAARYNGAIASIQKWKKSPYPGTILYKEENANCTARQREELLTFLGDAGSASSAAYVTLYAYTTFTTY